MRAEEMYIAGYRMDAGALVIKEGKIITMLTMKYDRKDFWGRRQYTEDNLENYDRNDIKKAFLFLGKEPFVTVQKENIIYFWENSSDFENRIMTVRTFDKVNTWSYSDEKMSFDKVKKEGYKDCQ